MASSPFQNVVPDSRVLRQVSLRDYSTMRVGGPADYLIEPTCEDEIIQTLHAAKAASIPVCVVGNGSNLLFSDAGFRGVILHIGKAYSRVERDGLRISAQSGALLSSVSRLAAEEGLSGMEFASGIPGSTGGAVYMNAGAYGGEIAQVLETATVYTDDHVETWDNEKMRFGYRHSAAMEKECVILSAVFSLKAGDKEEIFARMNDLNGRRREKQPLQYPSCGSFFKRPEGHFAGALIEQAGLKGYSVGDAQVSEKHAGFIINRGNATAHDIRDLMHHVQSVVLRESGVMLEPEVRFVGSFDA